MTVPRLTHEYAERVIVFTVTGAADIPPQYLCDPPAAVPPMRPDQVRAVYHSRNGGPWSLETVHVSGRYVPADPASRWSGCRASGLWLYPSSPHYPHHARPQWTQRVASALAAPTPTAVTGSVTVTATSDLARRMRYFALDGLDEITHWTMPAPLRPDQMRVTYLSSGDTAWSLDEIEFQGPHVATGRMPGPGQARGRQSFYPTNLGDAPAWVRDLAAAHRAPDPLPAGQPA
ncbi:hypothetical protein AB0N77_21775 [Streptomyces misionensis]|uniref:hypothetical protein n=1 Tax=Streptomyces misionensis TaxID=67331 RepID=UPI0034419212